MKVFNMPKTYLKPGSGDLCKKCTNRRGKYGCVRKHDAVPIMQGNGEIIVNLCNHYYQKRSLQDNG